MTLQLPVSASVRSLLCGGASREATDSQIARGKIAAHLAWMRSADKFGMVADMAQAALGEPNVADLLARCLRLSTLQPDRLPFAMRVGPYRADLYSLRFNFFYVRRMRYPQRRGAGRNVWASGLLTGLATVKGDRVCRDRGD